MSEKRWNECITLEGDYVDKWSRILPKSYFISHPTNLLMMCYIKKYFKDSNSRIPKTQKTQPNLDKSTTPQQKTNREKNK